MNEPCSRTTPAALSRLRALAEAGGADACVQLGRCLVQGWGCRPDEGAALDWFFLAPTDDATDVAVDETTTDLG